MVGFSWTIGPLVVAFPLWLTWSHLVLGYLLRIIFLMSIVTRVKINGGLNSLHSKKKSKIFRTKLLKHTCISEIISSKQFINLKNTKIISKIMHFKIAYFWNPKLHYWKYKIQFIKTIKREKLEKNISSNKKTKNIYAHPKWKSYKKPTSSMLEMSCGEQVRPIPNFAKGEALLPAHRSIVVLSLPHICKNKRKCHHKFLTLCIR